MHIIILPGWQQNNRHWESVCSLLKNSLHDVSFINFPGFGVEPVVEELQTLEDAVDWVEHKIACLSVSEPLLIVGHSFGGRVAVTLAARQSSTIAKLILIGSPNLYHADFRTTFISQTSKLLHPLKAIIPEYLKIHLRSSDFSHIRGSSLQNLFANIITLDQTLDLQKITSPVKLIWGENDIQVPLSVANALLNILTNAELEVVQGACHDIHLDKPNLLAGQIMEYAKTF